MKISALFKCVVLLGISSVCWSQQGPPPAGGPGGTQVQGTVKSFADGVLVVVDQSGQEQRFTVSNDLQIQVSKSRKLEDIKPGDFVGSAAVLGDDGKRYAEEVHFIPETMRSRAEGHRDMTGANRTMTNATVEKIARNPQDPTAGEMTLRYSGGEKVIIIRSGTPVTSMESVGASELKPGVKVNVGTAKDDSGNTVIRMLRIQP